MQVVKRAWLPMVIVVVVVLAGFTVRRVRGFFASEPDLDVTPQRVDGAELPWTFCIMKSA